MIKALKDLRQNKDRVILTADKGVALVVLDPHDNINKAIDLLVDRDTHRPLILDLTNKIKTTLSTYSGLLKWRENYVTPLTKDFSQHVQVPLKSMGYLKYTERTSL